MTALTYERAPNDLHRGGHRGEHQLVNAIDKPYRLFTKRLVAAIA